MLFFLCGGHLEHKLDLGTSLYLEKSISIHVVIAMSCTNSDIEQNSMYSLDSYVYM